MNIKNKYISSDDYLKTFNAYHNEVLKRISKRIRYIRKTERKEWFIREYTRAMLAFGYVGVLLAFNEMIEKRKVKEKQNKKGCEMVR